jgi:hypothetical protein
MGSKENGLAIFRPPFRFCCKMTMGKIAGTPTIGKSPGGVNSIFCGHGSLIMIDIWAVIKHKKVAIHFPVTLILPKAVLIL